MFRFSLQPVLEHREAIEEKRQRELHEVRRRLEEIEQETAGLRRQIALSREAIRDTVASGARRAHLSLHENWMQYAESAVRRMNAEAERLVREEEERRRALAQAARDRKIIEKLKEEERKTWLQNENRLEQQHFDELALREYLTRRREEKLAGNRERTAR